jgi:hypothetical protein
VLRDRIAGCEVEVEAAFLELDLGGVFDDLLEEEGCDDGARCLVEVVPIRAR